MPGYLVVPTTTSSGREQENLDLMIADVLPLPCPSWPPFRPHPLLRSGHLQTIVGVYTRPRRWGRAVRHRVTLPDGDRTLLHDDPPPGWRAGQPAALLLHGLLGSHDSPYMLRVAQKLNARGVRTFRMDGRGCGAAMHLARHPGHAGRSEDVLCGLQYVGTLCPGSPLGAIGFSLGGNLLLKLVGQQAAALPRELRAAFAVSPPIDLIRCSVHLQGASRIYDRHFTRGLARHARRQRPVSRMSHEVATEGQARSLYEFDDRFTAPLSGFQDARDYYVQSSSAQFADRIRVATCVLAADDDPLIPSEIYHRAPWSSAVEVVVTAQGGHLGYIGVRDVDPDARWMDWRIVDWVVPRLLGTP